MERHSDFQHVDKYEHGNLEEMVSKLRTMDIDGRQIIQLPDGEFVEYVLMEEEYFVDNWLMQFAIGFVGQRNYFDQGSWNRITDGYTKGVIVLNANKDPVLVIRKFVDMDLNVNQSAAMNHWTRLSAQAAAIKEKSEVDAVIAGLAGKIEIIATQNPEYDTLTQMIPYQYYLSKGIIPQVMKQVIWIRDNYTYKGERIDPDSELLKQVEAILYKNAREEKIEPFEVNLIDEITNGDFIFHEKVNKVDTKSSFDLPDNFDPLAD